MAKNLKADQEPSIADEIVAIRERWHFKHHPFFKAFADGKQLVHLLIGNVSIPTSFKCFEHFRRLVAEIHLFRADDKGDISKPTAQCSPCLPQSRT